MCNVLDHVAYVVLRGSTRVPVRLLREQHPLFHRVEFGGIGCLQHHPPTPATETTIRKTRA